VGSTISVYDAYVDALSFIINSHALFSDLRVELSGIDINFDFGSLVVPSELGNLLLNSGG
jgi:hypothetical protein